jgi:phage gp16-like protein
VKQSAHPATNGMIATIHVLKAQLGLDDDNYRGLLERETGKRSSKELSVLQAVRFIAHLRGLPGASGDRPR